MMTSAHGIKKTTSEKDIHFWNSSDDTSRLLERTYIYAFRWRTV